MSHDVLMMVYGALIGVGSSIMTAFFQSWINRRERRQQHKEERKSEQQKIQIPTMSEVTAINSGKYPHPRMDWDGSDYPEEPKNSNNTCIVIPFGFIALLLCGGIIYFIYWIDNPILYLVISGLIGFYVTFMILKFWQAK